MGNDRIDADVIEKRVLEIIARVMDRPASEVKSTSLLELDLGMQSLDYLDLAFALEREYRVLFSADGLSTTGQ